MSVYSQSTIPRTFDFLRKPANKSIDLNGSSKKRDLSRTTLGTWEDLMSRTDSAKVRSSSYNRSNYGDSSRRTINATLNEDKAPVNGKKILAKETSPRPGNWNTLISRTGDNTKLWDNKRHVDGQSIYKETVQSPVQRRVLMSEPLKSKYDYTSQISSLPMGQVIRESDPVPVPTRHYSYSQAKYMNDCNSSIQTLPGSLKSRPDHYRPSSSYVNPVDLLERNLLTTQEQLGPQIERRSPMSAKKNAMSTKNFEAEGKLHILYRPREPSEAKRLQLQQSPERNHESLSPTKSGKGRLSSARDQFRSSIRFG